jgi:hypothetical protein
MKRPFNLEHVGNDNRIHYFVNISKFLKSTQQKQNKLNIFCSGQCTEQNMGNNIQGRENRAGAYIIKCVTKRKLVHLYFVVPFYHQS